MTNRREFLHGSLAASLLTLSPGLRASGAMPRELPLYKILFDARDTASVRFAADCAAQGLATHALRDAKLTAFWRDELAAVWAQHPAPLAGFTDANVLFCLEQFGRQYGLRVRQRETQDSGLVVWSIA